MRWEDFRPSDYVEDRRGQSGGGGFGVPLPGSRGGLGFGTLIIVGILAWALGIDPRILIQGAEVVTGGKGPATEQQAPPPGKKGAPADPKGRFGPRKGGPPRGERGAPPQTRWAASPPISSAIPKMSGSRSCPRR